MSIQTISSSQIYTNILPKNNDSTPKKSTPKIITPPIQTHSFSRSSIIYGETLLWNDITAAFDAINSDDLELASTLLAQIEFTLSLNSTPSNFYSNDVKLVTAKLRINFDLKNSNIDQAKTLALYLSGQSDAIPEHTPYLVEVPRSAFTTDFVNELMTLIAMSQLEEYSTNGLSLDALILAAFLHEPSNELYQSILNNDDQLFINHINSSLVSGGASIIQTALEGSITAYLWDIYNASDSEVSSQLASLITTIESLFDLNSFSANFKTNMAELKLYHYYKLGDTINALAVANHLIHNDSSTLSASDNYLIGADINLLGTKNYESILVQKGLILLSEGDLDEVSNYIATLSIDTTKLYTLMAMQKIENYGKSNNSQQALILSAFLYDPTNTTFQDLLSVEDQFFIGNVDSSLVDNGVEAIQTSLEGSISSFLWDIYNSTDPSITAALPTSISNIEKIFDLNSFSIDFKTNMAEFKVYYYYSIAEYALALSVLNSLIDNDDSTLSSTDLYLADNNINLLDINIINNLALQKGLTLLKQGNLSALEIYLSTLSGEITELYTLMAMQQLEIYSNSGATTEALALASFLFDPTNTSFQNNLSSTDQLFIGNVDSSSVPNGQEIVQNALEGSISSYLWTLYNSTSSDDQNLIPEVLSNIATNFELSSFSSSFKTNMAEFLVYYYYSIDDFDNSLAVANLLLDNNSSGLTAENIYLVGADLSSLESTNIGNIQFQKALCLLNLNDITALEAFLSTLDGDNTELYTLMALKQLESYSNSGDIDNTYALASFLSDPSNETFQNELSSTDQLFIGKVDASSVTDGDSIIQSALEGSIISKGWNVWNFYKSDFLDFINTIETRFEINGFSDQFQSDWAEIKSMEQWL